MKFKTNARCMGCVSVIRKNLSNIAPEEMWEFDLSSEDKTMTYIGTEPLTAIDVEAIKVAVESVGFKIEQID